ncbi:MAG: histidine--tRNA ligase [Myxococcota bacterium]
MAVNRARGTRDFLPEQMHDRLFVIGTIAEIYQQHGFEPLDTPAFERIETLMGKYGDEGDKLIFKILKRGEGEKLGEVDQALRYDLTVPLARVVAMENPRMPFKRYHMGPVWRADRPGKGRFREFWQCDVDICGTTSTLAEAECITAFSRALGAVGFGEVVIRLNHRSLLRALSRQLGVEARETELLVAVDKLDKIGVEGVDKELEARGLGHVSAGLWPVLLGEGDPLERVGRLLADQPETAGALDDLRAIVRDAELLGVPAGQLRFEPTLARGLDYYTGAIWEAVLPGREDMGSLGGGGRYDGLIGMFGKNQVPAVGCAVGLERLLVLREENGMKVPQTTSAPVLVTIFDSETRSQSIVAARAFRDAGVGADLYPDARKLGAQLKHADELGYPFALILGKDEIAAGTVQIKNLKSGDKQTVPLAEAIEHVRNARMA